MEKNAAMRDVVLGLITVLGMGFLLVDASALPAARYEPLGPRFLALVIPAAILALAAILLARGAMTMLAPPVADPGPRPETTGMIQWVTGIVVGQLLLYAILLEAGAGYWLSTVLFVFSVGLLLSPRKCLRSVLVSAAVAVIATSVVDFVMGTFLHVILP